MVSLFSSDGASGVGFLVGLIIFAVLAGIAWLTYLLLYGFGELIYKVTSIEQYIASGQISSNSTPSNSKKASKNAIPKDASHYCPCCGSTLNGAQYCKKCGTNILDLFRDIASDTSEFSGRYCPFCGNEKIAGPYCGKCGADITV